MRYNLLMASFKFNLEVLIVCLALELNRRRHEVSKASKTEVIEFRSISKLPSLMFYPLSSSSRTAYTAFSWTSSATGGDQAFLPAA